MFKFLREARFITLSIYLEAQDFPSAREVLYFSPTLPRSIMSTAQ